MSDNTFWRLSPRERRKVARRIRKVGICALPTIKYPQGRTGASTGAESHKAFGEEVCAACADARRVDQARYARERYARANASKAERNDVDSRT